MGKAKSRRAGKWVVGIFAGATVTAGAGLAGLMVLGTASRPPELLSVSDPFRHVDYDDLPKAQQFKARDGQMLSYRLYPGTGPDVVVLIHGSSGEGRSMHAVAKTLNAAGDTVYVPDMRGHGRDGRPGDIDYIGQLDDDLADLVGVIRPLHPAAPLILAGHSAGGGFVLRIAEGAEAHSFDRFLLLSPALTYGAVTYRPNVGGWATPYVGRIIALKIVNKLGLRVLNGLPIVAFAVNPHAPVPLDDEYSFRMQANFSAPPDAVARLSRVTQPLAVMVGSADELFYADRFAPLVHRACPNVPVTVVPGVDHMGMVTDSRALAGIAHGHKVREGPRRMRGRRDRRIQCSVRNRPALRKTPYGSPTPSSKRRTAAAIASIGLSQAGPRPNRLLSTWGLVMPTQTWAPSSCQASARNGKSMPTR